MDRGGGVSRIRVLREKGKGIKKRKNWGVYGRSFFVDFVKIDGKLWRFFFVRFTNLKKSSILIL